LKKFLKTVLFDKFLLALSVDIRIILENKYGHLLARSS